MPNGLLADLVFRHGRDELVVDEQSVDVKRLVARGVRGLEFSRLALFHVLHAREQSRLEQFTFVFELLRR